jgi:hypothetical protein
LQSYIFFHFSPHPQPISQLLHNNSLRTFVTIHIGIHITKILANPFIPVHQLFISGTLISTLYALTKQPAILLIYSFFPQSPYTFCTCGWWKSAGAVAAMFAGKGMAVLYVYFRGVFCHIST